LRRLGGRGSFVCPFVDAGGRVPARLERCRGRLSGQALYAARCAACHGINGKGQSAASHSTTPLAPPHDASGHTWRHPDFALIQLTKSGASDVTCLELDENAMPRFEQTLTDRDVIDVLSYIKSTWPAEIRAEQDAVNRLYGSQNAAVRNLLDLNEG
jgi:mono/diheme cytochrome c family protein